MPLHSRPSRDKSIDDDDDSLKQYSTKEYSLQTLYSALLKCGKECMSSLEDQLNEEIPDEMKQIAQRYAMKSCKLPEIGAKYDKEYRSKGKTDVKDEEMDDASEEDGSKGDEASEEASEEEASEAEASEDEASEDESESEEENEKVYKEDRAKKTKRSNQGSLSDEDSISAENDTLSDAQRKTLEARKSKRYQKSFKENKDWVCIVQNREKVRPAVIKTLELLEEFIRGAPHDPTILLRQLAKAWKNNSPLSSVHRVPVTGFDELEEDYEAIKALDSTDGLEGLLRYVRIAKRFREYQEKKTKDQIRRYKKVRSDILDWVRIGTNIMQLCYIITPKSLFGLIVLHLMRLTPHKIATMDEEFRVVFMAIMTPSAGDGSINRLVPQAYADTVDVIVEGIIPMLEFVFCYNLRQCRGHLVSVFKERFVPNEGEGDEDFYDFTINVFGKGPHEPPTTTIGKLLHKEIVGRRGLDKDEKKLNLCNSHFRIDPDVHETKWKAPTPDFISKVYEYQECFGIEKEYLESNSSKYAKRLIKPDDVDDLVFRKIHPQVLFFAGCARLVDRNEYHKVIREMFSSHMVHHQEPSSITPSPLFRHVIIAGKVSEMLENWQDPQNPALLFKDEVDVSDEAFRKYSRKRKAIADIESGSRSKKSKA